jgi:predicted TIM-barrel fold metal-dependent hydrolase
METGRSETCPIIEMHGHLGPYYGAYLPLANIAKMRATMARQGVVRAVCSPHIGMFGDPDEGNATMQQTIDAYPDDFLGYWMYNPNYFHRAAESLGRLDRSRGFVGLKLGPDYHMCALTDPRYAPALAFADERRMLVLIHTWGFSEFDPPQQVAEVAARYPRAQFLMGHSGYGDWEASVGVARDLPNAYLELTAVYVAHDFSMQPGGSSTPVQLRSCLSVNGIIEHMVEEASSKKVILGMDLPWYSPHFGAGAVLFARIDDEARHDILHRNAERLLADLAVV